MGSQTSQLKAATDPEVLASRIKTEFPVFHFKESRLVNKGDDHAVLILDNAWIFRFPRTLEYQASFGQEVAFLKELRKCSPIEVPFYEYISSKKDFGGYQMIKGEELTLEKFNSLSRETQEHSMLQLAEFLNVLHSLPTNLISRIEGNELWNVDNLWHYERRYLDHRRSLIAPNISNDLLQKIDAFYPSYTAMKTSTRCITHSDLTDYHILVNNTDLAGVAPQPLTLNDEFLRPSGRVSVSPEHMPHPA